MLPTSRDVALCAFVLITFVTLGRPPGAVQLRTRDVETEISASGKAGRELKMPSAWILLA